jgi:hypothetical protein
LLASMRGKKERVALSALCKGPFTARLYFSCQD